MLSSITEAVRSVRLPSGKMSVNFAAAVSAAPGTTPRSGTSAAEARCYPGRPCYSPRWPTAGSPSHRRGDAHWHGGPP
eukprot:scaffold124970_cov70-Phaeocystis_antarctica.AAC.1